jgi:hypothetical protein
MVHVASMQSTSSYTGESGEAPSPDTAKASASSPQQKRALNGAEVQGGVSSALDEILSVTALGIDTGADVLGNLNACFAILGPLKPLSLPIARAATTQDVPNPQQEASRTRRA